MLEEIKKKIEKEKENYKYMYEYTSDVSVSSRWNGISDGLQKALDIIKEVENE